MKTIQLSGKKSSKFFALVSDADYEFLMQWSWHCTDGYACRTYDKCDTDGALIRKITCSMHRVVAERSGLIIDGLEVDHRNTNRLDNMRENLRVATSANNQHNTLRPSHNTSGVKGVSWYKPRGKWKAQIQVNSKNIYLGLFARIEDAAAAYAVAAAKFHGEFANLG